MTAVRSHQDAVFNRTGRVEIPASHIRRRVDSARIQFQGIHGGSWSESLGAAELAAAVLYVDIQSLLLTQRTQIASPVQVFETTWAGIAIDVPNELTNGDHRTRNERETVSGKAPG